MRQQRLAQTHKPSALPPANLTVQPLKQNKPKPHAKQQTKCVGPQRERGRARGRERERKKEKEKAESENQRGRKTRADRGTRSRVEDQLRQNLKAREGGREGERERVSEKEAHDRERAKCVAQRRLQFGAAPASYVFGCPLPAPEHVCTWG